MTRISVNQSPAVSSAGPSHYGDVIMGTIASQITSLTIVYSTVYSDADQRKKSKLRVTGLCVGIHRGPVNSRHKWPVTRKIFPFDDVIMVVLNVLWQCCRIQCGQSQHRFYSRLFAKCIPLHWDPSYEYSLTLIPKMKNNYIHYIMLGEFTY